MYDLIVIGGGPAGYRGAERAASEGLKTLLIEKSEVGGVCLNEGCVPTKTILYSAKIKENAVNGERYGVVAQAFLDHAAVMARKQKVVATLVNGVKARLKSFGVQAIKGKACITGRSGDGFEVHCGNEVFSARRLLIATGSEPIIPPIKGAQESFKNGFCITSREALELETVPASLCVIGGGVIGLELASYYASAGSEVTVIEMLESIGGNIDPEISVLLKGNLEKKGIRFHLGCRVTGFDKTGVLFEHAEGMKKVKTDKALLSVGRRAFAEGIGLEKIGVLTDGVAIVTDEYLRTNIPGVYAAGDVNGKFMLAHTAYREAEAALSHMLGRKDPMNYRAIPSVIYTSPEVAGTGETQASASQKGTEVNCRTLSMRYSGRYVAENEGGDGIAKIVIDSRTGRMIGFHMIGSYASEIIFGACIMIEREMTLESIRKTVFPHPTVCEIIREAVFLI